MKRPGPWTPARIAHLKELWANPQLTTSDMAAELGHGLTKSSICGKANRLRLPMRVKTGGQPRRPSHPKPLPPPPPPEPKPIPQTCAPVTMIELERYSCRYPVSDGAPWLFCGAQQAVDSPYCSGHARLCYTGTMSATDRRKAELAAA